MYPHLPDEKGLAFNWKEPGEHYFKAAKGLRAKLLETWREEDVHLPEKLIIFDAKGEIAGQKLSPTGIEWCLNEKYLVGVLGAPSDVWMKHIILWLVY